jgi:hypothetical protein
VNAVEKFKCQRESSFSELFAVLEDKDSQDAIRSRASEVKHCRWLRKDPNACESFVEEILDKDGNPTVRKGDPCPNNPIHKYPD